MCTVIVNTQRIRCKSALDCLESSQNCSFSNSCNIYPFTL